MGTLQFKNNASTTLSGSINNSQTAITVASAASFPAPATGDYFYVTMYELSGSSEINIEIVKVTAVSGNNWTIVRAQDGTTARARDGVTTCYIEQRMTAASAQLMLQKDNNLSDVATPATARTNLGLGTLATQDANAVAITGGTIAGVTITGIDSTTTIADNADSTKKVAFEVSGVTTSTTRTLTVPNASGTIALTSDLTSGYQPLDSDLTALAGLSANGLIARTGSGTVSVRTVTPPAAGLTITNGDGVSGNPTLALANDLAAVEGLSTTGFVRRTGVDTWSASAIVDGDLPSALTGKTYNALTLTANATGFSVAGGTTSKTLTVSNSVTLAGTDGTTITLPGTSGTVALNNQTMYIGTSAVAINRASASLSLTGVNIDGSAGSATTATTATKATNLAGGNNTTLLGSIGYQSNTDTTTLLSPNVTTTKQFLSQTGTGTNGAAPAWSTVSKSDVGLGSVENTALSTWAGSSNITTLGTVATGTWNATTISIAKGGTGATTAVAAFDALSPTTTLGDVIYHNGTDNVRLAGNITTTRKFMRQTGTGTVSAAPAWDTLTDPDIPSALTGKTYNSLTLTAAAVGFTIAGGSTSKTLTMSNTLTLSGTDGSTLNVGTGGTLGTAAFTASSAYAPAAGSVSIVTVGTITSGTWTGSAVGISYGGTGATSKTAGYNALSPMTTLGDLEYHDGTNGVRLAGSTSSSKRFLTQTGTGTVSAAPGWNAIVDSDLPSALTGKTYNGLTLTANATGFQLAGGTTSKTLVVSNNLTLAGTDGSTLNIGAGGTLGTAAYTAASTYLTAASPSFTGTLTGNGSPGAGVANAVFYGPSADNSWGGGLKLASSNGTSVVAVIQASTGGILFDYAGSTRMQVNSTGLGIGTAPSAPLDVNGSAFIHGLTVGRGGGSVSTNVALGLDALLPSGTTGGTNVGVGYRSLGFGSAGITGSGNVGIGYATLYSVTSGNSNIAIGNYALQTNSTGSSNVCIGQSAGNALTTGSNNTIIGSVAGTAGLSDTVIIAAGTAERARITSSGGLLIGTNTTTGYPTGAANIFRVNSTTYAGVSFDDPSGGLYSDACAVSITAWQGGGNNFFTSKLTTNNVGDLLFSTQSTASADATGTSTERMRLNSTGNLGIGLAPSATWNSRLQVKMPSTTPFHGLSVHSSADQSGVYMGHSGTVGVVGTTYGSGGSYTPLTLWTSDLERVRIDTSGNVSIGTTAAGGKLHINNTLTFASQYTHGTTTGTTTVSFANGQNQKLTLTGNATLSFTFPGVGSYQLFLVSSTYTVTWPTIGASWQWLNATTAPTLNTGTYGGVVNIYYDGTIAIASYSKVGAV